MKKYLLHVCMSMSMFFVVPLCASAATVSIQINPKVISVGDTVVARVVIDTEGQNINSTDGQLLVSSPSASFTIEDVNTAGSDFTVWLKQPTVSSDKKTIVFIGGIPGGIVSKNVKVFNLILKAVRTGEIALNPVKTSVFLNDGKGTTLGTKSYGLTVIAHEETNKNPINEWNDVVLNDKIPPQKFIISLGSDASVFDGKTFIAWSAVDNESGIDHYDVLEGNLESVRVISSPYVLQNQNGAETIQVTAFDKAGNSAVSVYVIKNKLITYGLIGMIVLVVIGSIIFFIIRRKNKTYVA